MSGRRKVHIVQEAYKMCLDLDVYHDHFTDYNTRI